MKRLQIYIDEDLDDALGVEARKLRTSKAALIRAFVAERLRPMADKPDPIDALIGAFDYDPETIDDVVYR